MDQGRIRTGRSAPLLALPSRIPFENLPPTPLETLERAKAIADAEGLHYVYIGNVPGHPAENTYCPKCRKIVVERTGYTVGTVHIHNNKCQYCQQTIPGVWRA